MEVQAERLAATIVGRYCTIDHASLGVNWLNWTTPIKIPIFKLF